MDNLPDEVDVKAAKDLNRAYNSGVIGREEFLAGIQEVTGSTSDEVEKILWDEIDKNTLLLDYIEKLRYKSLRIGLLSNIATNWVRESFLSEREQALFDSMILSFEVGMTKPDPRIFMLACQRLRVGPHESIFIDDIERYCEAAENEGLGAIHYKNFKQMKLELEQSLANNSK